MAEVFCKDCKSNKRKVYGSACVAPIVVPGELCKHPAFVKYKTDPITGFEMTFYGKCEHYNQNFDCQYFERDDAFIKFDKAVSENLSRNSGCMLWFLGGFR